MTDRRFLFGVTSSVAWLLAAAILLALKHGELAAMTPNAWGDFFAGCFAPLAFLWLVLGYLQQGEELRLSTQALRLQAEELRNSVEQQRALVEVSRLQVEGEREALAEERQRRTADARPKIVIESDGGSFRGDGQSTYPIILSNTGNGAVGLVVTLKHQLGRIQQLLKVAIFERGAFHRAQVEVDRPELIEGAVIELSYEDHIGNTFWERYLLTRQTEHPHSHLKVQRITR